ncbi:amidase [Pseudorhodoferax sp. LjRoot39]|uniref:amidase n=1 Tax=Pseudorhodoferax sp. LjRoot39 TaxID=3342328 RepID=UPI003ECFFC45
MPTHRTDQYALADCAAHELVQLYRTGQASPLEVASAVFGRMDRVDGTLKAFCHLDPEGAAQAARASTQRWQQGTPIGPLDGVPVSIKDLILTQGMPTRRGSATIAADQPWEVDAPVAARLRAAGAVIVGKTATPEFGCKCETNSPLTGLTRNPWNAAKTTGGSSGGAAAAVAAGMAPIAIGTDGAGSIRNPAALCGTFGLKPSFGRVPAWPLSPFGTVAHLGPHTMSVLDAAMVMNVIKQPDARDWTSLPFDSRDYLVGLNDGVRGLRVAWSPTLGYAQDVHPEVAAATLRAAEAFVAMGALVEQIDPGFADPLDISAGLWFLGAWQVWSGLTPAQQALTDPDFAAQAQLGSRLSTLDVQDLHMRRGALGSHMRQFMGGYDLLLTPAVSIPAFDALPAGHRPMDAQSMLGWSPFSYPFNLTQQPACSIPCGLTSDGLPIGLQIVGPMFGDAMVLRAARAYESMHPIPRPDLTPLL